jgi:hypothetical protein
MRWLLALSLVVGGVVASGRARAQAPLAPAQGESFLSVTREAGAEGCPDRDALSEHVGRLRGLQATSATGTYHVTFSFRAGVYRAAIRFGGTQGQRVLRDRGSTCASLEQATALTLALLLDSDASALPTEEEEPPAHDDAPPPAPAPAPPPPDHEAPKANAAHVSLLLSAGGAGLSGMVNPIAPAVTGELGLSTARFRAHVGVLWVPEQTLDLEPGTVNETLFSGVARMCLSPWHNQRSRFDLCSGSYAGVVSVEANGYPRNDDAKKPWLALPLELAFLTTPSPIGVELGASALVPLRRSDFSIDNLGVAYESWPVGVLVSMRAVGSWLL